MDKKLSTALVLCKSVADLFAYSKGVLCAETAQPLGPCKAKVTDLLLGLCALVMFRWEEL